VNVDSRRASRVSEAWRPLGKERLSKKLAAQRTM
jgi:hypothetical protein